MRIPFTFLLSAALLAVSGPAQAAGLPQLNVATYASQLIWLAITFGVLYLLMSRLSLPRIADVLEDRQHRVDENLKKAEQLRAEAKTAEESYEAALAEARASAHETIKGVRDAMAAETAERQAEMAAKMKEKIVEAEAGIAAGKDAALKGIAEVAADVAVAATERLLGEAPAKTHVTAAVDAAVKERS